jgi:hypothetical protein
MAAVYAANRDFEKKTKNKRPVSKFPRTTKGNQIDEKSAALRRTAFSITLIIIQSFSLCV